MRAATLLWIRMLIVLPGVLGSGAHASAADDATLAVESVEPARIRLGESATLRVTSFDGYLKSVPLPTVPGLTFEMIGRSQGVEFANGASIQATYILIRVTPQFAGVFSIPGLTPTSPTVGLEVLSPDAPNPSAWRAQRPASSPPPLSTAPVPKGIQLKAGGAAFVQLVIPNRTVYVGESVPVDIELGVRPGIVTALNGLPALATGDFTLNNLSKQPLRRDQLIEGSPFLVLTWHSAVAAVKPGDFSLSVSVPLSVRIDARSASDVAFSAMLGWPFTQASYNGIAPKDMTIESPAAALTVLPLPTSGRPGDFAGAIGEFQVASDASVTRVTAGDPLTLRLHVSGVGNFDRVAATMFDHLDHWRTYPAKATFTPSGAAGDRGEKIFEQPLIAALPGEQSIPGLEFSYFNPNTRRYERAQTEPIKITVLDPLAERAPLEVRSPDGTPRAPFAAGLRADHRRTTTSVGDLQPLYFRAPFLAFSAALALIMAGSAFALRPRPGRGPATATEHALARLDAAARAGDSSVFFDTARTALLETFARRWQLSAERITPTEWRARLGPGSEEIDRLFALAEEAKYSHYGSSGPELRRWIEVVRGQLSGEKV